MTSTTPVYELPYLDGMDGGKHIKSVSKSLALRLEAVLINEGQVPLDSDLVALLTRLTILEDAVSGGGAGSSTKDYNGIKGPIPASARMLTKRGFGTATRDSSGVFTFAYPEPFPNEIAGFHALTIEGAAVQPVINGASITRTTASLIWVGAGAGTCKFSWTAWGY